MGNLGNFSRNNLGAIRFNGGGALALTRGNLATNRPGGWRNWIFQDGATTVLHTAALPTGYYPQGAWRMPIVAGELSFLGAGVGDLNAALIPGMRMTISLTGSGGLTATAALAVSMVCAITGSGGLTASIQGRWNMQAAMTGSGDLDASMAALGNLIVQMLGVGDLDATIGALGNMSVDIVVTGTGLSTANVGQAVWSAIASANNVPGTMGEKLNDAGSASNPWTEVIESGYTAAEILRLLAAAMAGKTSGAGTANMKFTGIDGSTERIDGTLDVNGNRTSVTLDGS